MKKLVLILSLSLVPAFVTLAARQPLPQQATSAAARDFLNRYCVSCHSEDGKIANLWFTGNGLDVDKVPQRADAWERVLLRLRTGLDPKPTSEPGPAPAAVKSMVSWLESELDRGALPNLTAPGDHRLNRTEYGNAVRDIFGVQFDPTTLLPQDDSTHGFDNIASALGMSQALVDGYSNAAATVSALAIGNRTVVACRPLFPADETSCARSILTKVVSRAYRRPASAADLDAVMDVYATTR